MHLQTLGLALSVIIALVAIPVLLRKPTVGIAILVTVPYANLAPIINGNLGFEYLFTITVALGLAMLVGYNFLYGKMPGGSARFVFALSLWMLGVLTSIVFSPSPDINLDALRNVIPILALSAFLFLMLQDMERLAMAFRCVAIVASGLAALTVFQWLFGLEAQDFGGFANGAIEHISADIDEFRPSGPIADPNYYAMYLIPGLALTLNLALHGHSSGWRIVAGLAATLLLGAILITASRGAMISAALASGLILWRALGAKALFLGGLALTAIALTLSPEYLGRIASLFNAAFQLASGSGSIREGSLAGRLAEMQAAWIVFTEHPLTGVGYGQFETYYQSISIEHGLRMRAEDRAAHSLYLETAAEQGVVGLLALFGLISLSLGASLNSFRIEKHYGHADRTNLMFAFGAGMLGVFVGSIFLHDAYAQYFWVLVAILFATERANGVQTLGRAIPGQAGSKDDRVYS